MKRLHAIRAGILGLALLAPASLLFSQDEIPAEPPAVEPRAPEEIYSDLNLFGEIFDRIRAEYVDPPDERELIRAAIQGMLSSLDPHSGYLPPDDYEEVREDTSGTFGGLGIEITMEDGIVKVVSPIDDTPAAEGGILANDLVIEVDGEPLSGMTLDAALRLMRGPVDTDVTLTISREGVAEPLTFELTRAIISVREVRWRMEEDVAVLRLARFSEQAYRGLEQAIEDIYAERDGVAPTGIVLDLRNNPGGLVDQSIFVADAFLERGVVMMMRGRIPSESTRYDARPDALDRRIADVPVVVLINGGSASAAEIVAGALQDHRRATIVGTRSYGKGSVQSITPLGPNGAMRMTTARYYTPSNRSIQAAGIVPDIVITQNVPPELQGQDEIIGEAGLAGHIEGENEEAEPVGSSVYIPADPLEDTQLQYALSLIAGDETHEAFPAVPEQ